MCYYLNFKYQGVLRTLIAVVTGAEDPNAGDSTNQTKEVIS